MLPDQHHGAPAFGALFCYNLGLALPLYRV